MPEIANFWFNIEVHLNITEAEVDRMIQCSQRHYDGKCKQASERGGILYGWKNHFPLPEGETTALVTATWRQIDLICKILEREYLLQRGNSGSFEDRIESVMADPKPGESPLYDRMIQIFKQMREESERVNQ